MSSIPDGFEPLPVMGPFDHSVAPLYWRRKDPQFTLGMLVELRHCNLQDIVHGGAIFKSGTPEGLAADEEVRRIYLGTEFRLD